MRTAAEIRARYLEMLDHASRRPGMWGGNADGVQILFNHLLRDLCFIDGVDEAFSQQASIYLRGCRGACGQFYFQHRPFNHYTNEVASVYLEVAFQLGYFQPKRLLSITEMTDLRRTISTTCFFRHDWSFSTLCERFGTPSHGVGSNVICYASQEQSEKWVFFDLVTQLPGKGYSPLADPILRDFRADTLNKMRLLPFGRRWVKGKLKESEQSRE